MGRLDPGTWSLATVFRVPEDRFTPERGRRLASRAFDVNTPGADEELVERRLAKAGNLWAQGELGGASWRPDESVDQTMLRLEVFWHEQDPDYTLAVDLNNGDRLPGFVLKQADVDAEVFPEVSAFLRQRLVAIFDVLEPPWGCADLFDRIGFGTDTDPKQHVHWLNFYGPEHQDEAHALADELGVDVDERDWGGLLVQAWQDPFDPPEEHQPIPDPTTVQATASPLDDEDADNHPRNGVLVAGIDPFTATTSEGEPLADAWAGERADIEDLAAHVHAARQAGDDFDPGPLRLYPSFRHDACRLGIPIATVPISTETPSIEPLDTGLLDQALSEAADALDRLHADVQAEPELFLVMTDTAGTEGI